MAVLRQAWRTYLAWCDQHWWKALVLWMISRYGPCREEPMNELTYTAAQAVAEFGEEYRAIIVEAFAFLDRNEAAWDLPAVMDRRRYIQSILRHALVR